MFTHPQNPNNQDLSQVCGPECASVRPPSVQTLWEFREDFNRLQSDLRFIHRVSPSDPVQWQGSTEIDEERRYLDVIQSTILSRYPPSGLKETESLIRLLIVERILSFAENIEAAPIDTLDAATRREVVAAANLAFYAVAHSPFLSTDTASYDGRLSVAIKKLKHSAAEIDAFDAVFYPDLREKIRSMQEEPGLLRNELKAHLDSFSGLDGTAFVDRLFNIRERHIDTDYVKLRPGMIPYAPYSVRGIIEVIALAGIQEGQVFYDLGAGMGRNALLIQLLTGCSVKLVEFQDGLHSIAQRTIDDLRIKRAQAIHANVVDVDLSDGDVFYMFNPFGGEILHKVKNHLRSLSEMKPITVVTIYMSGWWDRPAVSVGPIRVYHFGPELSALTQESPICSSSTFEPKSYDSLS